MKREVFVNIPQQCDSGGDIGFAQSQGYAQMLDKDAPTIKAKGRHHLLSLRNDQYVSDTYSDPIQNQCLGHKISLNWCHKSSKRLPHTGCLGKQEQA